MVSMTKKDTGSVIFLIFLAIFLFGALTYMFVKSSRTGDIVSLTEDKAAIYAGELLNYTSAIREGIDRMMLLHGVKDYQFDFETGYEDFVRNSANTACTTNKCRLFHPEGGAVKPRLIPINFWDTTSQVYTTNSQPVLNEIQFYTVSVPGVGTSADELVLMIPGLNLDICKVINQKMSGISPSTSLGQDIYTDWTEYNGNLTTFPTSGASIDPAMYAGKKTFCIGHSTQNQLFISVMLER